MNKIIRNKVFETNSSSCHSITISSGNAFNDVPLPNERGLVTLISGEFGWERETYHDFYNKAAYIIVYIRDWTKEKQKEFRDIFENAIKEVSGCIEIQYEDKFWDFEKKSYKDGKEKIVEYTSYLGNGYIDHQSVESQDLHYLFEENEDQLRSLLFTNTSYIETDNDNH